MGGTVIDGTGAAPHQGWTVLIRDSLIAAVGPDVEVPSGAELRVISGYTVVPGLIDMHGHMRNGEPITCIRGAWDAACERAGLKGRWFHDLRRTAVRQMERACVPRTTTMKITGHKTEAVYRRYAITDKESTAEGMKKIHELRQQQAEDRSVVPFRKEA